MSRTYTTGKEETRDGCHADLDAVFGASAGKSLGFIFHTSQCPCLTSAVRAGVVQRSGPACLSVPKAGTGCERIRGVAALGRIAERERG